MDTMSITDNSIAYINGTVYTIGVNQWASAFIVSGNGVFTHVGSTEEVSSLAKEHHLVIVDLKGAFIMPGLHDAHMHLLMSGLGLTSEAAITPDATHLDIAEKVKHGSCACEHINVYQNWILAGAYNNANFPDMKADRAHLDALFPDQPVAIRGGAGHSMFLNTAALKISGYDIDNQSNVPGVKFFTREDGSLTGEVAETAMAKAALAIPAPSPEHVKRALTHAVRIAHRSGVTSTQEASSNSLLLRALRDMDAAGTLKFDVATHIVHDSEWIAQERKEDLAQLLDASKEYSSAHVHTRFVKIMLDGVPLPPLFTQAGIDEAGNVEHEKIQLQNVAEAVKEFDRRGLTVKIHCTGHGATRLALDAIEAARKANADGPRHEIAHNSGVSDDDYKRYAPLNVTAEMSPAPFFDPSIGASSNGLMDWNFPKMQQAGAHITIGSDWGVMTDPSLFKDVAKIVKQVGSGDMHRGGEIMCRMLTLNGAIAVGREKEVGSIEVGKKANFIVVDRDLSRGEFEGARVLRTYFEGEKVWDARD